MKSLGDLFDEDRLARRAGVLVVALVDRVDGGLFDKVGSIEVGEALGKVDGFVLGCEP